jgi:hypothetical protein
MRGAEQSTIECVRPCVIGTLNSPGQSPLFLFNQPRSAVATHVIKAVNLFVFVANDDEAFATDFSDEVLTGFRDVILVPDQDPLR